MTEKDKLFKLIRYVIYFYIIINVIIAILFGLCLFLDS